MEGEGTGARHETQPEQLKGNMATRGGREVYGDGAGGPMTRPVVVNKGSNSQ